MGVVYEAYDPDLDRRVALKLLHRHQRGTETPASQRLLREAQAMAKLDHPNVIRVHDVGTFNGTVFVAMEFVDGQTLRGWLKGRPSPADVLDALVQAGRGLAAAHQRGLVHRDFKPDNVMVAADGRVRVMDFGLVRSTETSEAHALAEAPPEPGDDASLEPEEQRPSGRGAVDPMDAMARVRERMAQAGKLQPADHDDTLPASRLRFGKDSRPAPSRRSASEEVLTRTGAVLGTPAYMSPEQVHGTTVDARSDQFSFAVTAWEALVGKRPFQGATLAQLADAITSGLKEAPPVVVGVPRFVVPALTRALATAPEDRFDSMEVLTDILSRDPAARRNLWLRACGAVAVTAGLGAATWAAVEPARCSTANEQLARVWNDTSRSLATQALLATGVGHAGVTADKVDQAITRWGQRWVAAHTEACEATRVRGEQSETILDLRMACLDQRIAELDALLTMLANADADIAARATEAATHLSTVAACADRTALTRTVDPPPHGPAREKIAEVRRDLAQAGAAEKLGRYLSAAELAEGAQLAAATLGYRPLIAEAAETRGRVLATLGETDQAIQQLRDAALHARASGHIEVAASAETRLTYVVGFSAGRRDDGLAWSLEAQAEIDRLGGDRPVSAELLSHRAVLLQGSGDSAGALAAFSDALKARERLLGPEHPDTAESRFNLGVLHLRLGQYQHAQREHERALQIRTSVFGPEHPSVADSLMELGSVAMRTVHFAEAATLYSSALTLRRAAFGEDHVLTARAHENLANAAARQESFEAARTHYAAALAVYERRLGKDDPRLGRLWMNLGTMELLAGRVDAARIELQRAADHFERVSGRQHPEFGWALAYLGRAYHRGGDNSKALETLSRAADILEASAAEPLVRGIVRFDLAKVLIETSPQRAAEAAAAAEPLLLAAGAAGEPTLEELRSWQRATAQP